MEVRGKVSVFVASHPKVLRLQSGHAAAREYEWHRQEGAAMHTAASLKPALARGSCSDGKGVTP
jgi:hypothetical protein